MTHPATEAHAEPAQATVDPITRMTFYLPASLKKALKIEAIKRGQSATDLLIALIRARDE